LGGLWNHIRAFRPDYIFSPPVTNDPLAGIHIDHEQTAHALRFLAYQLSVPNAYPTIGREKSLELVKPLIINVDDPYSAEPGYHACVDIGEVYDKKTEMVLCHECQIYEWIPYVSGQKEKETAETYIEALRKRHEFSNSRHNQPVNSFKEYFSVTRWGRIATKRDMDIIFPNAIIDETYLATLED
jgi:LmbE family N-acetylglucosaminyl deacetylase